MITGGPTRTFTTLREPWGPGATSSRVARRSADGVRHRRPVPSVGNRPPAARSGDDAPDALEGESRENRRDSNGQSDGEGAQGLIGQPSADVAPRVQPGDQDCEAAEEQGAQDGQGPEARGPPTLERHPDAGEDEREHRRARDEDLQEEVVDPQRHGGPELQPDTPSVSGALDP